MFLVLKKNPGNVSISCQDVWHSNLPAQLPNYDIIGLRSEFTEMLLFGEKKMLQEHVMQVNISVTVVNYIANILETIVIRQHTVPTA